jgi:hypothetical protein
VWTDNVERFSIDSMKKFIYVLTYRQKYSKVKYSKVKYSKVKYSKVKYSTVKCSQIKQFENKIISEKTY